MKHSFEMEELGIIFLLLEEKEMVGFPYVQCTVKIPAGNINMFKDYFMPPGKTMDDMMKFLESDIRRILTRKVGDNEG